MPKPLAPPPDWIAPYDPDNHHAIESAGYDHFSSGPVLWSHSGASVWRAYPPHIQRPPSLLRLIFRRGRGIFLARRR